MSARRVLDRREEFDASPVFRGDSLKNRHTHKHPPTNEKPTSPPPNFFLGVGPTSGGRRGEFSEKRES